MTNTIRWILVAGSLAALACSKRVPYSPVDRETKFSEGALYEAARKSLQELDYQTVKTEPESFLIETAQVEVAVSSVPRLSYRYYFRIVTSGGTLQIEAACEENSSMEREGFNDCGDDRPKRIMDELATLEQRVLELAVETKKLQVDWEAEEKKAAEPIDEPAEETDEETEEAAGEEAE